MPSVAIIGTRGYPSYYGGFETAVRKLAPYLCDQGWEVTVYGRPGHTRPDDPEQDPRVKTIETRGIESKTLSTLTYGFSSVRSVVSRDFDVVLAMNVANGFWLGRLRRAGIPTAVNVDGIEWDRDKWSALAKRVFLLGARLTAKRASKLIFDAKAIAIRWQSDFHVDGTFLPYGGCERDELTDPLGLPRRRYVLLVARLVPENSIREFFDAVPAIQKIAPVVLVGTSGYGGELDDRAASLARQYENVQWLRHISDDDLLTSLWQNAGVYFHGHSVGGTNPALVQAMALGAPVVARNTVYNAEVLDDSEQLCDPTPSAIVKAVTETIENESFQEIKSRRNKLRARAEYSWPQVCAGYESVLRDLLSHRYPAGKE
jgi:glycosyltransferase involved in cell wall biosynthesis